MKEQIPSSKAEVVGEVETQDLALSPAESQATRELKDGATFTTLGQKFYKDDNGRDVDASLVQFLAPYLHVCDGFYNWECGRCGREDSSRACGWPIAGQVLKCSGCGAMNLLVKTNTVELDALVSKKNQLDLGLMRLASDRAAYDAMVKRAATDRLRTLEGALRSLLTEITKPGTNTDASSGTT